MDRLTIQRREGGEGAGLHLLHTGHAMQPIRREERRAEAADGTAGWADSEPMSFIFSGAAVEGTGLQGALCKKNNLYSRKEEEI